MYLVFLAIIGIPVIFVMLAIESGKKEAAVKKSNDMQQQTVVNMRNWIAATTDDNLEGNFRREFSEDANAAFEKHYDELMNACTEIWGNYVETHGTDIMDFSDGIRILMANRGKLTKEDAERGVSVDEYSNPEDSSREIINKAKLVCWMDRKLKDHGVNEQLLAIAFPGYFIVRDEHLCNDHYAGTYLWKPMVHVAEWHSIKEFDPTPWYEK